MDRQCGARRSKPNDDQRCRTMRAPHLVDGTWVCMAHNTNGFVPFEDSTIAVDPRIAERMRAVLEDDMETQPQQVPQDEKLPAERAGVTQKFTLIARRFDDDGAPMDGVKKLKGYITASVYPATRDDGTPHPRAGQLGEIFVKIGKSGSDTVLLDEWAISISRELQRGVDPVALFAKHRFSQFEPSGAVQGIKGISRCSSPTDLVSNWIGRRFLGIDDKKEQP